MSPFAIIISLLFAGSTSASIFLASIFKKSKSQLVQEQQRQNELQEELEKASQREREISEASNQQIEELKAQIQNLQDEKEQAFEQGKQAAIPDLNEAQTEITNVQKQIEKYEQDLNAANSMINQLKQKATNFDIERHKILLEELNDNVNLGQNEILQHLSKSSEIADLIFPLDQKNNFIINFDDIITSSNLKLERHYLSERFKLSPSDTEEKTLYVVLFSAGGNVILIDGKLSAFLEKNYHHLGSNDQKVNQQIQEILRERMKFLSSEEFKKNIKATLEELDNVRSISNIHSCIYFPSELIISKLASSVPDFSKLTADSKIHSLSPASLVNIIQNCKFLYETEQEIIKYQILADIISDFHLEELKQTNITETVADIENEALDEEELDETEEDSEEDKKPDIDKQDPIKPEILADIGLDGLDLSNINGEKKKSSFADDLPEDGEGLEGLDLDDLDLDKIEADIDDGDIENTLDDLELDETKISNNEANDDIDDLQLDDIEDFLSETSTKDEVNDEIGDLQLDEIEDSLSKTKEPAEEINDEIDDLQLDDLEDFLSETKAPAKETNDEIDDLQLDDLEDSSSETDVKDEADDEIEDLQLDDLEESKNTDEDNEEFDDLVLNDEMQEPSEQKDRSSQGTLTNQDNQLDIDLNDLTFDDTNDVSETSESEDEKK